MPDYLDLDLLRTFVAIKDSGGFHAAGKAVGRTQAAVSHQIKRLEEIVEKPLFERTTRKVRLTPYGELLIEHAKKMLEMNDEALLRIKDASVSGVLRLGAPEAMTSNHLPRILALFSRSHPNVILEVTCGLTEDLLYGYEKNEYDVVIFKRSNRSEGQGKIVYTERLAWMKARHATFPDKSPIPVILTPEPCNYRKRTIETLQKSKRAWRIAMTLHSFSGRVSAVKEGLGISVLPHEIADGEIVTIRPGGDLHNPGQIDLALLPIECDKHTIAGQFVDCVVAYFRNIGHSR